MSVAWGDIMGCATCMCVFRIKAVVKSHGAPRASTAEAERYLPVPGGQRTPAYTQLTALSTNLPWAEGDVTFLHRGAYVATQIIMVEHSNSKGYLY